jgi:hypothetical protein
MTSVAGWPPRPKESVCHAFSPDRHPRHAPHPLGLASTAHCPGIRFQRQAVTGPTAHASKSARADPENGSGKLHLGLYPHSGALQNLGYEIGRGTIAKVLKEAGVDPLRVGEKEPLGKSSCAPI